MKNLLDFLARYNHWLLFIILEVASFVLLFQFNNYQGSVWFSSANAVSGKVFEWSASVEQFFALTKVNEDLTQRNLLLEQQVRLLADSLQQRDGDATLLQKQQLQLLADYRLIPAKVVSNTVNRRDNFITIDKGAKDGVKKDMGVVCGNGVVGIVYLVSDHYSILLPVLNSQSNISCTIKGRGYFGYLHWTGGATNLAYVDDIPRHAHFKLYDQVVTSGYSSVFPPGILVGKILHVYNSSDGLSYRLNVKLSTDFANLRDVCVIDNTAMVERIQIMQAANDSIKEREE
ncbi:rod shape-determining protein MreC [Segatella baroniae F0067]|uniref:Cell shape-determining protein MreC n=1 Tax=Segatella baroniae F0067 TaxID=1115809 RepID=U2P8S9_9BACT|nr:rod shape-determining protein MreC [Segatella baroniae]ERK40109.1 rod shape-determining protein MreC [Segatella baroniae F0067]